jgi:DMSO/TMAO reductase YedYZ heme-binding membrane subunit
MSSQPGEGRREAARLEAFSDGVMAVIIMAPAAIPSANPARRGMNTSWWPAVASHEASPDWRAASTRRQ